MNYQEARAYLNQISKSGSIYGLETIGNLMNRLGNPQNELKFIHLAGTNGKGSILNYTANILKSAGYTVGAYISPSVMGYLEKFQINGQWMEEDELPALVQRVRDAAESMEASGMALPTVFEMETAIAFLYFAEKGCQYVVLETGLGGDTDSTNIVSTTEVCAFAAISLDHTQILGDTLEEIAEKKSGIIKAGSTVITGWQKPEVLRVLTARARELGCSLIEMDRDSLAEENGVCSACGPAMVQQFRYGERQSLCVSLLGRHQLENAAVAIEIADALRAGVAEISEEALRLGLETSYWPGRFEVMNTRPQFILDGAHNEDAALRLADSMDRYFPGIKAYAVIGMFKDKNCRQVVDIIAPHLGGAYTVALPNTDRTLDPEELKEMLTDADVRAEKSDSIKAAIQSAAQDADRDNSIVLITGSLSYLGEAKKNITEYI